MKVYYRQELDGGGRYLARPMTEFIRQYSAGSELRRKAFEWCCGPAFIGFSLIAENVCKCICLADINPEAVKCIQKTVAENRLEHRVTYYASDNFNAIPRSESFDFVIGNPPMHYNSGPLKNLCFHDPGWSIRQLFYANVLKYLNKGAFLFISEAEPFKKNLYIPGSPVPHRQCPRPPLDDFMEMIEDSGLRYVDTVRYMTLEKERLGMYLVISKYV